MVTTVNLVRRRHWHPTPVLLPGKSHGGRSLVGCSPWGRYESDAIEQLHFHFPLSHNGEGNGNPLQCSCLENPRDCGAWWAAVYGVARSRTQLNRLSSSSRWKVGFTLGAVLMKILGPPSLLVQLGRQWFLLQVAKSQLLGWEVTQRKGCHCHCS